MRKRSRRRRLSARRAISSIGIPPTIAAAMRAPMLVPAYTLGLILRSSRARKTPMCAKPFMPPPPSTSATRFPLLPLPACLAIVLSVSTPLGAKEARTSGPPKRRAVSLLQILIQPNQSDDRAADHYDVTGVPSDHGADEHRSAADDHHRFSLA